VTPGVIDLLESYSFRMVAELGLQSIDESVLKECNRTYNIEKIEAGIECLEKSNLFYRMDLMYGLPGDTFFKFYRSARFLVNHSRKQNQLRAHHFMLLNNSSFYDENVIGQRDSSDGGSSLLRFHPHNSSLILDNGSESVFDLYLTKLFLDVVNKELKLR